MHSCLVRLERIKDAGIDFLIVTLLFASVHIRGIVGLQAARDRFYAYSYTRVVPQLTYNLHRTSGLEGDKGIDNKARYLCTPEAR
jgi:hypothetical protein